MENQPESRPPRRPLWIAFVFGVSGLLVLDGAIQLLLRGEGVGWAWLLVALGLALIVLGVLWGSKRI